MNDGNPYQAIPARLDVVQLDRIEAKIDRLISGPENPVVTTKEARFLCGCKSYSAFYRIRAQLGFKAVLPGKYRRVDITNAIARKALDLPQS